MKPSAKPTNGNQPATQHDLSVWGGMLTERVDGVDGCLNSIDGRLDGMDSRLDHIEDTMVTKTELAKVRELAERSLHLQEVTLKVVESVEGRLKEMSDHGARIRRLEKHVFA